MKRYLEIAFVLAACSALYACASKAVVPKEKLENVTKVIYRFEDSSVPPAYHRSYTKEVTGSSSSCVVDSYGEIITHSQYSETSALLTELRKILKDSRFEACYRPAPEGCTGGTGERIHLMVNEEKIFSAEVYHCGGKDYGTFCGGVVANINEKMAGIKCKLQREPHNNSLK